MRMRAVAIILMVAAGVGIHGGGFMSRESLFHTRDTFYHELHLADLRVRTVPVDPTKIPSLEKIGGIKRYEKRLITPGTLELKSGRPLPALIYYINPQGPLDVNQLKILEGKHFDPMDPYGVVIDQSLAESHGYRIGDTITLNSYTFPAEVHVVGIGVSPECLIATVDPTIFLPVKGSLGIVFAPSQLMKKFFGYLRYNDFSFIYKEKADDAGAEQNILEALGSVGVENIVRKKEEYAYKFLEEDLKAFSIFIPSMIFVFAIIIFFITLITATRLVISQRQELGALTALGYRRRELAVSYLLIAVLLNVAGGVVGAGLALFLNILFSGQYAMTVGLPNVIPKVVGFYIVQGWFYMSAVVLLAFFLPFFFLMRLTPQQIIRDDLGEAFTGLPRIVERFSNLFSARFRPGMTLRFGFRNLFRRPGLTAATTASVALCIAATSSFIIVMTSFEALLEKMISREQWDITANFRYPQTLAQAEKIRKIAGIGEATPLVIGFGQILLCGERQNYQLIGIPSQGGMRKFELVQGRMFQADNEKGIILNKNWVDRERLQLQVGKVVEVKVGERTAQLPVIALINDLTIGQAYLPIHTAQELFGLEGKVSALMFTTFRPVDEIKKDLYRQKALGSISTRDDIRKGIDQYVEMIQGLIYTGLTIGIGIAIFFLFGSVALNILERESEYATLRAIGYGRALISKIVLTELMSEGITGIVVSIPVSLLLALYLNYQAGQTWVYVPTVVKATDLFVTGGSALLFIPLASIPGLRQIFRMNIPAVVRRKEIG